MFEPKDNDPVLIGKWISILYRQFQIYLNHHLKDAGVSSSEYLYLLALYHEDGLNQDTITTRLLVDKAATARGIKSLEEKGLVTRQKDPNDKRANKVFITEAGRSIKAQIIEVLDGWNDLITNQIPLEVAQELSKNLENISTKVRQINWTNKERQNE